MYLIRPTDDGRFAVVPFSETARNTTHVADLENPIVFDTFKAALESFTEEIDGATKAFGSFFIQYKK